MNNVPQLQQLYQWIQNLEAGVKGANAAARRASDQFQQSIAEVHKLQQLSAAKAQEMEFLKGVVDGLRVSGTGSMPGVGHVGRPDALTIEQIPGRRVPYDLTIQIGIPDGQTSPLTGSYPLSMDGPFVAVARYATFISSYTFQVASGESVTRFTGRTWGRQRMISSTLDLMDAVAGWVDGVDADFAAVDCGQAAPPTPSVISRPTSRAAQRSMTFDGYIEINSATYPRQNQQVPTSLWAPGFNQMLQLPVLDYWEKGETIECKVEPLHVNNPSAGNIQQLLGSSMPYLAGQFDGHEGVGYSAWQCTPGNTDVIARRPSGILVLGFLGYKILQPPGVRMR